MSADAVALFDLGHKLDSTYAGRLVGQTAMFADLDRDTDPEQTLSGMMVEARLVRNSGAGALAPGSVVKFSSPGTTVVAAGAADIPAGVVDPWLNASVAQNETFWMIFEGPAKIISSAAFSANDPLITAASGKAATGAVDHTKVGKAIEAASGADELVRAYISVPAVV